MILTSDEVPVVVCSDGDVPRVQMYVEFLPEVVGEGEDEHEAYSDLLTKLRDGHVATMH